MVMANIELLNALRDDLCNSVWSLPDRYNELNGVGNYHAIVDYFHEWRCDHHIYKREMVPNLAAVFSVEGLSKKPYVHRYGGFPYIPVDILLEQALEAIELDKRYIVLYDLKPAYLGELERELHRREFELTVQEKIAVGLAAGKASSYLDMKNAREMGIFYNPAIGTSKALQAANEAVNLATEWKQYLGKDYDVYEDIAKYNRIANQHMDEDTAVGLIFQ